MKWFFLKDDDIKGPFSTEQIKAQLANGMLHSEGLIWGNPLKDWISTKRWLQSYKSLVPEGSRSDDLRTWHFAYENQAHGPFVRSDLILELRKLRDKTGEVLLWQKGMKNWAPLFDFHDIMEILGVNRRQFPRAPIDGQAIVQAEGQTLIGQLKTISEGGFGAIRLEGLYSGLHLSVELKSKSLASAVHAKAVVCYSGDDGFVGFKFIHVNREALSVIVQFVKSSIPKLNSEKVA